MDYSPPGTSVHGIIPARILEWVVICLPEDLPHPGLTKFPAGNFTDPKAIHDFDFYISQMDNQLLEGEHS